MSVILRDGPSPLVTTRYGGATDHASVAALHARCSERTLTRRFHSPLPRSSDTLIRQILQPENGWSVLAEHDGDVVAMACVGPLSTEDLEVGILVEDAFQGAGLGTRLLREVASEALARGYRTLLCLTHPDNHAVLGVARSAGLTARTSTGDGVMTIVMALDSLGRASCP